MDLHSLPAWSKEGDLHVVIECPRGSQLKLKYDPTMGVFTLSRALVLGLSYPYDWGFIPGTRADDGDPVDAMVLIDAPTCPGLVIPCRPLGVVELSQKREGGGRERNDRVIAAPCASQRAQEIDHVDHLPRALREELEAFFTNATLFEGKDPRVLGWKGRKAAERLIRRGVRAFK
jgi:inorganic pyrophosphatase